MRLKTFLCLPCVLLASSLSGAEQALMNYMGDDAEVVLSLRSVTELAERWEANPLREPFQDEAWANFWDQTMQALLEDSEVADELSFIEVLEDEFDLSVQELKELFPGQFALVFYDLSGTVVKQMDAESEEVRSEFALMADFGGTEERLDELMAVQFQRNAELQKSINPAIEHEWVREEFMGVTLHFDERFDGEQTVIEDGYALVDGVVVLATPAERLRRVVESLVEGPDAPMVESDAYLRSREESGRGDFALYVNLERLLPPLLDVIYPEMVEGGLAMAGVTEQTLADALGLEELQFLYCDLDLSEDGVMAYSGLVYREKRGLLEMIAYSDGDLPSPNYVPETVASTSVSRFDISEMLAALEGTLRVASPTMMPLFDMQLMQVKQSAGVDLRSGLLDNFGGEFVSLTQLPDAQDAEPEAMLDGEQVVALRIKDSQALSDALSALMDLVPMVKPMLTTQEFEGTTIYSMSDASGVDPAEQFSYAITRDQLLICVGRIGLLQTVLSNMHQTKGGFWELASTEAMFEPIAKPRAVARSYDDFSQQLQAVLDAFDEMGLWDELVDFIDMDALPEDFPTELKMVTETNEADDGIFSRGRLFNHVDD